MNEVSERFVIKLRINNQEYPITVRRDKEEIYRAAEKRINEKLNRYKQQYPHLGEERYVFMTMLDLVTKLIECEKKNDTEPYLDILNELTSEIEEVLPK